MSVFHDNIIKRAAQFALKKNNNFNNEQSQQAFVEGFLQAIDYIEREVACRMEYENMSGSIPAITNYDQEETWRLYATRKEWDFLYEDNKEENDDQENDYKERIIDTLLYAYDRDDTKENLIKLTLIELEQLLKAAQEIRFGKKNK